MASSSKPRDEPIPNLLTASVNRRTAVKVIGGAVVVAAVAVAGGYQYGLFRPAPTRPAIKRGGSLTVAIDSDIVRLDPHASTAAVDRVAYQSIFGHFVDLDENLNIVPAIAEKWTQPNDKTYLFTLRDGVKFHDGTKLDADAVKFNYDRMLGKLDKKLLPTPTARASEVSSIDKVEVVDPLNVRITLKDTFAPFLGIITDRAGMFVSPTALQKDPEGFIQKPVGAGPFKFVEWKKGDQVAMERFADYYEKDLPYLDRVVIVPRPDASKRLADLRAGTVDFVRFFADRDVDTVKSEASAGRIEFSLKPSLGWLGYEINTSKPPFDNKAARKAFQYATDAEEIVRTVYFSVSEVIYGPITSAHKPYIDPDFKPYAKWPTADPDLAKKTLADAGMSGGFEFELQTGIDPVAREEAELLQAQLLKANIKVKVSQVEFTRLLTDTEKGNYQVAAIGWSGRPDPDQNIYGFYHSKGSFNFTRYANPAVDDLLERARKTVTVSDRVTLYRNAIKTIVDDAPYVFIRAFANSMAWRKGVAGFVHVPDTMIRTAGMFQSSSG